MRDPTRLGKLFRERRKPLGWERVVASTKFRERAIRTYESGGVTPPIDKALILAELYGIDLEELAVAVLGRPYEPSGARSDPRDPVPARENTVGQASARDKKRATRPRKPQQSPHRPA